MIGSVVDKLVSSQELARSFYEEETQSGEVMNESDGSDGIKSFTKVYFTTSFSNEALGH